MSCATRSPASDDAALYAQSLLADLGCEARLAHTEMDHPAIAWSRAGLFGLTGHAAHQPLAVPLPLAGSADGALLALKALSPGGALPESGAALLGERARLMGLSRNGRASPGGHCRLFDCADGRIALNLAREDDWSLLPALFGREVADWQGVEEACREASAKTLQDQGSALGMALAIDALPQPRAWVVRDRCGTPLAAGPRRPLVVDLSALWAGPLSASLLGMCAGEVIKVESAHRPDGARGGNARFFDQLNAGKRSVALDFRSERGRTQLRALLGAADIVIEASRPRALRQLGIAAEALVAAKPGKVWLRFLAHGDDENRIGFGDDIGVAAGLPTVLEKASGEPLMVGDAIADPLSGLHGALAAWASWQAGGGELLTVSMRDVVRRAMGDLGSVDLAGRQAEWQALAQDCKLEPYALREPSGKAEPLGESTSQVLAELC